MPWNVLPRIQIWGKVLARSTQGDKGLPVRVYDAEAVALGIGKDHVVGVWRSFAPRHLGGAQGDQALDLCGLVVCVQVQVNAWWYMEF